MRTTLSTKYRYTMYAARGTIRDKVYWMSGTLGEPEWVEDFSQATLYRRAGMATRVRKLPGIDNFRVVEVMIGVCNVTV